MNELAAMAGKANPMSSALDSVKNITGGDAGPSSATQGNYSNTVTGGVSMGNGLDDKTVLIGIAIMVVAYVLSKRI